jgi:DNA sulfur modification protein DndD
MIITKLTINNFGVYRGINDFELRPRQVETEFIPVVLFGGKNGAGKTTILEAIRLCLYGKIALGTKVRRTDYETYISQHIHRGSSKNLPAQSASVGLLFEHVHAGVLSTYDAVRSWRIERETVHETISIFKDGYALRDIPEDSWNDFLRDLIPPGVSDLFFFDGEQIQNLADEETESITLETAIKGLLNLDLTTRLKADLGIYIKQQEHKEQSALQKSASDIQTALDVLEFQYIEHNQARGNLRNQLDYTRKLLDNSRQSLLKEGAGFIENRTKLELRQLEVEKAIEQTRNAIRDLASELLPFAVAPNWSLRLAESLSQEEAYEQEQITYEAKSAQAIEITALFKKREFQRRASSKILPQEWDEIADVLQGYLQPVRPSKRVILHDMSSQRRHEIQDWIKKAIAEVPQIIYELGDKLEKLETERNDIRRSLQQIPDEAFTNPLLEEFHQLSEKKGILQQQIDQLDLELHNLYVQQEELKNQSKKIWQQLSEISNTDERVRRAAKVQIVLDTYLVRITDTKIHELEKMVAHYFNILCRKDMLVQEVKIDAKRYTVTLYGENRVELPKSSLSAGERQLYAMALLWALRSISGRMLPIIVDTPMGRLDTDHRRTLLKYFFPDASHQLILLSTDTEINEESYEILKPAISHVFLLNYDNANNCTTVERRYFTEELEGMES